MVFWRRMQKISAGLLMYRKKEELNVFLIHPGGPFFVNKDQGFWGIPKGEINAGEDLLEAAKREFMEETGIKLNGNEFMELGTIKQKNGKIVHAWAFEGDWSGLLISNYFSMEWPLKSGKFKKFPEVDKAGFFNIEEAKKKMSEVQFEFINRLKDKLI